MFRTMILIALALLTGCGGDIYVGPPVTPFQVNNTTITPAPTLSPTPAQPVP